MLDGMKNLLAGLTTAALLFVTSPSLAEETEPPKTKTSWYGWQTLIADGGTLAATYVTGSPIVFLGGYALGAPIVHWAHGNVAAGFGSLGVRVVAPIVTTFVVRTLDRPDVAPSCRSCRRASRPGAPP